MPQRARLYRLGLAASLAGAPLLFLISNLIHPEEFALDHEAEQLAEIGANYTAWQVAHLITFASIVLFAVVVLGLAYLVSRRRSTAGLIGGALGLTGTLGLAFILALDGYTWAILGEVYTRPDVDQRTLEAALHDVQQSTWSIPYYATPLLWIIGIVTLAMTAARSGLVQLWAALVFSVGAVLVGLEGAVKDNTYFIVAASVLLIGGAGLAYAVSKMPDAEFDPRA